MFRPTLGRWFGLPQLVHLAFKCQPPAPANMQSSAATVPEHRAFAFAFLKKKEIWFNFKNF